MIKSARLIRLFTQGLLAFILLFSPVSGHTSSAASAHPKIQTEWVSTPQLKFVSVHKKKHNRNNLVSHRYQLNTFAPAGKLKSNRTEWLAHCQPHTLLQKTIPFGTEVEVIA
jgi:hypothetical protein